MQHGRRRGSGEGSRRRALPWPLMLNWDPGNAAALGETPFPNGYDLLPKKRIGHCHPEDTITKPGGYDWAPVGKGVINWVGQFEALKKMGYNHAVVLETHWHGAAISRRIFAPKLGWNENGFAECRMFGISACTALNKKRS